eukprot:scaffold187974_cov54-Attheya_sp.AAC.1
MRLVLAVGMLVELLQSEILLQSYPLFFVPSLSHQAEKGWDQSMWLVQASSSSNAGCLVGVVWLVVDIQILSGGLLGFFAFRCVQSMHLLLAV